MAETPDLQPDLKAETLAAPSTRSDAGNIEQNRNIVKCFVPTPVYPGHPQDTRTKTALSQAMKTEGHQRKGLKAECQFATVPPAFPSNIIEKVQHHHHNGEQDQTAANIINEISDTFFPFQGFAIIFIVKITDNREYEKCE